MKFLLFLGSIIFSFFLCAEGLVSGTLIKTEHGYVLVEKLVSGYKILSTNLNGTLSETTVTNIIHLPVTQIIQITVDNKIIEVAPTQLFYVPLARRWIRAKYLTKNSLLLNAQGQIMHVSAVKEVAREAEVFCIIVKNNHNFFISLDDILVS